MFRLQSYERVGQVVIPSWFCLASSRCCNAMLCHHNSHCTTQKRIILSPAGPDQFFETKTGLIWSDLLPWKIANRMVWQEFTDIDSRNKYAFSNAELTNCFWLKSSLLLVLKPNGFEIIKIYKICLEKEESILLILRSCIYIHIV